MRNLAQYYIKDGAVTEKHLVDAQHIAIATVQRVDVLVSWNFSHIVNLKRIRLYNSVTLKWVCSIGDKKSAGDTMNNKKFDAVKMMRKIRDELSRKYNEDPEAEKKDLQSIRKKYHISDSHTIILEKA